MAGLGASLDRLFALRAQVEIRWKVHMDGAAPAVGGNDKQLQKSEKEKKNRHCQDDVDGFIGAAVYDSDVVPPTPERWNSLPASTPAENCPADSGLATSGRVVSRHGNACTEVTYKPLVKERCGGFDSKKQVLVDRAWVSKELDVISKFSAENNVPVWIDQWGLQAGAVGGDAVHDQYLDDILSEFDFRGFHWSYWIWRRDNNWATDGYAIERQNANGTYEPFQLALKHLGQYLD
eukprot:gene4049-6972_t